MKFEYDVFISYAPNDNKPNANQIAWVDNFSKFLKILLKQLTTQEPRIIFSQDLAKEKTAMISPVDFFSKVGTFISILTPEYGKNKSCVQELENFHLTHNKSADSKTSNIFKVVKIQTAQSDQPQQLHDIIGYDFFEIQQAKTGTKELVQYFGLQTEKQYWLELVDLAYDIFKFLHPEKGVQPATSKQKEAAKVIYLAETSYDQKKNRDILKRELQRHGYKILPEKPLPKKVKDLENALNKYFVEADLLIHVVGEEYGDPLEDSQQSVVDLQNKIAADYITKTEENKDAKQLTRLIWISPDIKPATEKQTLYIEKLKRDVDALKNTEIIQTPLEILKSIVETKMNEQPGAAKVAEGQGATKVYLIHDQNDKDKIAPIIEWMGQNNIHLITTSFEGDQVKLINLHRKNLINCDAVIIFYNNRNEQWMRVKLQDAVKAPGYGRSKPFLAKVIMMNIDDPKVFDFLKENNLDVIESKGQFSATTLQPFIEKIKNTK